MSPARSTWEHICSLLEQNDYVTAPYFGGREWMHMMVWRDMDLAEPTLRIPGMQVEVGGAPMFPDEPLHGNTPRATVRVVREGEFVGVTEAVSWQLPYWHANPQDVCCTLTLGVDEHQRRRGIGRYLMEKSLFEMKKAGCKHALLGVHVSNEPAMALYKSMGYETIDSMCAMAKSL